MCFVFIKLQILARISSFSLLRSPYNICSGLGTWKFWQILLILLNISVLISGHVEHDIVHVTTARNRMSLKISGNCLPFASRTHGHVFTSVFTWGPCSSSFYVFVLHFCFVLFVFVLCTGTCSIQKIYAPSSHIFWMKQVPVVMCLVLLLLPVSLTLYSPSSTNKTDCHHINIV